MRLRGFVFVAWLLASAGCAPDDEGFADAGDVIVEADGTDLGAEVGGDAAEEVPPAETTDEIEPACPPLGADELDLILGGDPETPMAIVTNDTPEGDDFLHEASVCLDPADPVLPHLVARMRRTLAEESGGVGLAAPQVGLHRRLFLAQRTDLPARPIQVFLNPWIVEYSTDTVAMMEGCLSVPGASPSVRRSLWVVIDYLREDGEPVWGERIGGARGTQAAYAARIVQHEYDHLEGILIVDDR